MNDDDNLLAEITAELALASAASETVEAGSEVGTEGGEEVTESKPRRRRAAVVIEDFVPSEAPQATIEIVTEPVAAADPFAALAPHIQERIRAEQEAGRRAITERIR
jgi:polysaccharide deacetylase 2 family uncharacterized protein YibQ